MILYKFLILPGCFKDFNKILVLVKPLFVMLNHIVQSALPFSYVKNIFCVFSKIFFVVRNVKQVEPSCSPMFAF